MDTRLVCTLALVIGTNGCAMAVGTAEGGDAAGPTDHADVRTTNDANRDASAGDGEASGTAAVAVSCGYLHSCLLAADHTVWCWGANDEGQLGDGTTELRLTPVQVQGLTGAAQVSASYYHSCALLLDGTVRCWGRNSHGELGDGTTDRRTTPVPVPGLHDVAEVHAGGGHTVARLADGTVQWWGGGIGIHDNSTTPSGLQVEGSLAGVRQVAYRSVHACALMPDGSVECWGSENVGELGDGVLGYSSHGPQAVPGLQGVVEVAVGPTRSCVRFGDGTARCWGDGVSGSLGNGLDIWAQPTPTAVVGLTDAIQLAPGGAHGCVLHHDGTVSCSGWNIYGQVGDGTDAGQRLTLTPVVGLHDVVQLSAGDSHTCAVTRDGAAWCWGQNGGRLGDGTTSDRNTPVRVMR